MARASDYWTSGAAARCYAAFLVRTSHRPSWATCCAQAVLVEPHPCVCAEVQRCPVHGEIHRGTHE